MLKDKKIAVTGIASKLSIASGIATALAREGADLVFSYQNEKLEGRVSEIAESLGFGKEKCFPLDVSDEKSSLEFAKKVKGVWSDGLDGLIHSIAFAPGEALSGGFTEATSRESFLTAHEISSYSLVSLSRALLDQFRPNSAITTLTYLGSTMTMPNYNVMGVAKASLEACVRYLAADLGTRQIRVNAVSAGPIRTLAASGIKDFRSMLKENQERTPLKRNTTIEEVGNAAAFLSSDLASGITGSVLYVDNGFNISAISYHQSSEEQD